MASRTIKITGLVIALFNIVNVLNSSWYFLGMAHFPMPAWLAFNACAPSVALYLAGYVSRKDVLLAASLPFLLISAPADYSCSVGAALRFTRKSVTLP